jgi:nucleoside-diphosphate-sugar epimerase
VTRVNVGGEQNILSAHRRYGVQSLVHTSGSELSGTAQCVSIDAAHPLQAQSAYSATKIATGTLVESYSRFLDVPAVTVCPFSLWPPAIRPGVIPTIIVQLLGKNTLKMLTRTRDFISVADTVTRMIAAMNPPNAIAHTGSEIAIGNLITLIGELLGTKPLVDRNSARIPPENSELRPLSHKTLARALLNCQAQFWLKEGLGLSIAWVESHVHLCHRALGVYVV